MASNNKTQAKTYSNPYKRPEAARQISAITLTAFTSMFLLCTQTHVPNQQPEAARQISAITLTAFTSMFLLCTQTHVPNQQFKIDNLKGFINYPSRTTVGTGPKVTGNRKFFSNLVATREFREMLEKDMEDIRMNYIKKMKYCDSVVMNRDLMKDFYDREVDQTKM